MSEAKHTPGPWWETDHGVRDRGGYICHARPAMHYPGQDERFEKETIERAANKKLIAAAPELLEALQVCKAALDWVVEQGGGPACEHEGGVVCFCKENNAINVAKVAIAKATWAAT